MRTYLTAAPMSAAMKQIISDRRASTKLLIAIQSGRLPIDIVSNGIRYVVSGARQQATTGAADGAKHE